MTFRTLSLAAAALTLHGIAAAAATGLLDMTRTTVVAPANASSPERKAVSMLIDEVERRTGVRWKQSTAWQKDAGPLVIVGRQTAVSSMAPEFSAAPEARRAEGFQNRITRSPVPAVVVGGYDARGVLYGVGHLLRNLEMRRGQVLLRDDYAIATAPETTLRGHQLGYRPKTNSYDGWSLPMWEQYIRDLVVFGANAVELIPPRSDDARDSPHFPKPQMEMMTEMSNLLDQYGLDVWIWYPAMDDDYSNPKTVEFALNEWGEVFKKLPRIDAVLVPAGDPGHTPANILMPFLEKQTANLRKHHPKAQMWLAPQGFDEKSLNFFFDAVDKRPAWLHGIVYGPQTRISLPDLRKRLPKELPIRHYPDITHTRSSQYPVPDWDTAWAATSSREPINPRPLDEATIFRLQQKHTIGFITYSEGCNDDVNKTVWSALGWRQDAAVMDILRDYGRYFIGPDYADNFALALLNLERNWRGPALTNSQVGVTLQQLQDMEKRASPQLLANWRFQQALYRAYYDAYVQSRLIQETALEDQAVAALRRAAATGSELAMGDAEQALDRGLREKVAGDLRTRVFQLAEALFQSIRMQLSVSLYQAISAGRGATLDTVDAPVTNAPWLKEQMQRIRKLTNEQERVAEIGKIIRWTDPGPGGFYDDLGNISDQGHLVPGAGYAEDPAYFRGPQVFFDQRARNRKSWWDHAMTVFEQPLLLKYDNLDPATKYKVRVVYGAGPVRLSAGESYEIHGYIDKPYQVLEYPVPEAATRDGMLTLKWNRTPGGGGAGRGCQVAEVWLVKEP